MPEEVRPQADDRPPDSGGGGGRGRRWGARILVVAAVGLASVAATTLATGCSPGYVLRAGWEEAKILNGRRPLPEVILDPAPRFADLLEEAPERAAELIRDETWASTDFDYALEGAVTVTARTVGGTVVSRTCRSGQALAAAMLGMGLEEMMLGRHGTMRAFVQEVDARLR